MTWMGQQFWFYFSYGFESLRSKRAREVLKVVSAKICPLRQRRWWQMGQRSRAFSDLFCLSPLSDDDVGVFLGLGVSMIILLVVFAILMFKKSARKRYCFLLHGLFPYYQIIPPEYFKMTYRTSPPHWSGCSANRHSCALQ